MSRTSLSAALATGLVTLLAAMPLSQSASAGGPAKGDECVDGKLCVFARFKGQGKEVRIGSPGLSNKIANEMNDQASSAINRRSTVAFLYAKRNGEGKSFCLEPGQGANLIGFNNVASSSRNTNLDNCPV